jgi:hypothetical protein
MRGRRFWHIHVRYRTSQAINSAEFSYASNPRGAPTPGTLTDPVTPRCEELPLNYTSAFRCITKRDLLAAARAA